MSRTRPPERPRTRDERLPGRCLPLIGEDLVELAPDDQPHQLVLVELCGRAGRDDARVLHHRRAVGEREHLLESVRDVNYRHAVVAERAEHAQQERDLVLRQRGGRLVQDEQPHVADERAPDHHQPLIGRRERAGGLAQVRLQADALADRLGRAHHLAPAHPPEPGRVVPDEHVLGRR